MKVTMSITTYDSMNNESTTRSFGYVTENYVNMVGSGTTSTLPFNPSGTRYNSFAAWADTVARGLASLSNRTYQDSSIAATWGMTEELNA